MIVTVRTSLSSFRASWLAQARSLYAIHGEKLADNPVHELFVVCRTLHDFRVFDVVSVRLILESHLNRHIVGSWVARIASNKRIYWQMCHLRLCPRIKRCEGVRLKQKLRIVHVEAGDQVEPRLSKPLRPWVIASARNFHDDVCVVLGPRGNAGRVHASVSHLELTEALVDKL